MPNYRRAFVEGGTFFFTIIAANRRPILTTAPMREALRSAFIDVAKNRPFKLNAIVLLPDHLHCIMVLPDGDADFSTRWRLIKSMATRRFLANGGIEAPTNASHKRKSERGVWQRRMWEHVVKSEAEYIALCNYIHYNPVRHGHAPCPHEWPYSSFLRFVRSKLYNKSWNCGCSQTLIPPSFEEIKKLVGE